MLDSLNYILLESINKIYTNLDKRFFQKQMYIWRLNEIRYYRRASNRWVL